MKNSNWLLQVVFLANLNLWQLILLVFLVIVALVFFILIAVLIYKKRNSKKTLESLYKPQDVGENANVVARTKDDSIYCLEEKEVESEAEFVVADPLVAESSDDISLLQDTEEDLDEEVGEVNMFNIEYVYSFGAKLSLADEEVKEQYNQLVHAFNSYGLKISRSWRNDRVYLGRKTYALILFKGRKLCVAYALDPKAYVDTKYRGIDASSVKRFEATPLLMKNTSNRKFKWMLELIDILLADKTKLDIPYTKLDIPKETLVSLISKKMVKRYSVSPIALQKSVDVNTAHNVVSDEFAQTHVIVEEKQGNTKNKAIVNIDTLSDNYEENEVVDLDSLRAKKLVPNKTDYVKVLARGVLDKPLIVKADDFSLDAIKMVLITGGEVHKYKK